MEIYVCSCIRFCGMHVLLLYFVFMFEFYTFLSKPLLYTRLKNSPKIKFAITYNNSTDSLVWQFSISSNNILFLTNSKKHSTPFIGMSKSFSNSLILLKIFLCSLSHFETNICVWLEVFHTETEFTSSWTFCYTCRFRFKAGFLLGRSFSVF